MNSEHTVTILMAVAVGAVIGHHADDIVEKNYPPTITSQNKKHHIELEYKIISSCINADRRRISQRQYQRKEEVCICAFKKLEFSNSSYYELEQTEYLNSFSKYINECQNE